jgi:hypothetical protein
MNSKVQPRTFNLPQLAVRARITSPRAAPSRWADVAPAAVSATSVYTSSSPARPRLMRRRTWAAGGPAQPARAELAAEPELRGVRDVPSGEWIALMNSDRHAAARRRRVKRGGQRCSTYSTA